MVRLQDMVVILLIIFCCADAHSGRGRRNSKMSRAKRVTKHGRPSMGILETGRSFRTKRDIAEANVHSLLSETNSLAAAAESIQAAENSVAAGLEAEESRKAFQNRVPKSAPQYPPEPMVREFIPDTPQAYNDDYYEYYDDYYYDPLPNRHTQFRTSNQQNQNRPPPLPPTLNNNQNQNAQQRQDSQSVQNVNSNFNAQQEVRSSAAASGSTLKLNLDPNPQQPRSARKEDIDLRKVFWLKLPDKLPDQRVHQKLDVVFDEVGREGKDVLMIPVSRELKSSDDVSEGFLKALGLRSALRRARRLRRLRLLDKKI